MSEIDGESRQANYPLRIEIEAGQGFVQCWLIPDAIADAQTEALPDTDERNILREFRYMAAEKTLKEWISSGKVQLLDSCYTPVEFFSADVYRESDQLSRQDLKKILNSLNIGLVDIKEGLGVQDGGSSERGEGPLDPAVSSLMKGPKSTRRGLDDSIDKAIMAVNERGGDPSDVQCVWQELLDMEKRSTHISLVGNGSSQRVAVRGDSVDFESFKRRFKARAKNNKSAGGS